MCLLIRFQRWHPIETLYRPVHRLHNGFVIGTYPEMVIRKRRICPGADGSRRGRGRGEGC